MFGAGRRNRTTARRPRLTAAEVTPEVFADEGFNEKRAEAKVNEVRNGAEILDQNEAFPDERPIRDPLWAVLFTILAVVMLVVAIYYTTMFATEPATFSITTEDEVAINNATDFGSNDTTQPWSVFAFSTTNAWSVPPSTTGAGADAAFVDDTSPSFASSEYSPARMLEEIGVEDTQDAGMMVGLLLTIALVAGVVGIAASYPFILLAHKYTNTVVHVALLLGPALLIFSGIAMISAGVAGGFFSVLLLFFGVISIALGILMLATILCCWGKLIPFTVRVVEMVASVAKQYPAIMIAPVIGGMLGSCWVLLCFVVFAGTGFQHYESIRNANKNQRYAGLFGMFLILYWGAQVARSLAHVTTCGVYGRWYFGKDKESSKTALVMASLKVALVNSYGSICLGSFLVAFVQAAEAVARQMMEDARKDGNPVLCCVACLVTCVLSCIGDILEYFNEWAYVQCAIRGLGFFHAAKATYSLCTLANVTYILDDLLINYVVLLGSLVCAAAGALAGAIVGLAWMGGAGAGAGVLIGFVSAFTAGSAAMSTFSSGAKTILTCWAESPETLRLKTPEEAPGAADLADEFENGPRRTEDAE
mmetsp:Transcript_11502/g.26652  ORF Transcript_11502/g.26652 Transcript_11502/m.26652 type:complete len:591 (+) Transcript_11502:84-1856(+)